MPKSYSDTQNFANNDEQQFMPHNFDSYKKTTQKRIKFNPTVEGIHDTERGKQTIRSVCYKYDASKLSVANKLNLPKESDNDSCK